MGGGLFKSSLTGQNICTYSLCAKELLLFFFFFDSSKLTKVLRIKLLTITKDACSSWLRMMRFLQEIEVVHLNRFSMAHPFC